MIPRVIAPLAATLALILIRSATAQDVHAVMRLIPPESHAALIVPNLKSLSDQITECLEGMDRANVLVGARPLDHFKAATGFNVGVNDTGTMAIALTRLEGGTSGLVFIVPVSDADAFIRTNLTPIEDGSYALRGGKMVHARAIGSHVVLAEQAAALQTIGGGESHETLQQIIGERGVEVTTRGEAFIVMRQGLISGAIAYARANSPNAGIALNLTAVPLLMAADVEAAVVAIDFDPLGVIVRSFARVKPGSRAARILGIAAPSTRSRSTPLLQHLPNKPFFVAAAFDLTAIGDREAFAELISQKAPPSLLQSIASVQCAAYPSPAGVSGGLLNDAVAVLTTAQPQPVIEGVKQALLGLRSDGPVRREVTWHDERRVEQTVVAAAYEVKTLDMPADSMQQQALEQALFGSGGFRGFVAQRHDAVIVTFSQRPATLKDALNAAEKSGEQAGLAAQSTVRSLRQWLPQTAAFQAYINPGHLAQFANAMLQSTPLKGEDLLPKFDASLPPVAVGVGPSAGGAEHALVIPSGVLAVMFDQAMRRMPCSDVPAVEDE